MPAMNASVSKTQMFDTEFGTLCVICDENNCSLFLCHLGFHVDKLGISHVEFPYHGAHLGDIHAVKLQGLSNRKRTVIRAVRNLFLC